MTDVPAKDAAASGILDSARVAVRPVPGELQVYKGALWASAPPDLLEAAVLRLLEDSGKLPAASRQGSGIDGDYRLVMDIRHFEADPEERHDLAGDARHRDDLAEGERRLRAILDPEAVDARAKRRQAELLASYGGREAALARGDLGFSPAPGTAAEIN